MEKEEGGKSVGVHERIAVCISSSPAAQYLIARAARMAQRIDAELYVIYVDIRVDDNPQDQRSLEQNLTFARNLGAQIIRTEGQKVAEAVAQVVREKHITQVVLADLPRLDGADICICRRSTGFCAMHLQLMSISSRRKSSETWQAPRTKETSWS